jgi:cytochrome oxidase assembly protein ShyY1
MSWKTIGRQHVIAVNNSHIDTGESDKSWLDYFLFAPSAVCGVLAVWQLDRRNTKVGLNSIRYITHSTNCYLTSYIL